jgi:branched-chain amino acid transport system substrate-binding protein
MMTRHIIHATTAGILTIGITLSAAAQTAVTDNKVVIHHIGPLTGVLANPNKEILDGARLYFDMVNAKGGVAGRQITLETLDDKQDTKESIRLFTELAEQKKVLTLFSPRTTSSTEALIKIAEPKGIPVFAPQNGGIAVTNPFKRHVFAVRASYQDEVMRAIQIQNSIGGRNFAFVTPSLESNKAFTEDTMAGVELAKKKFSINHMTTHYYDSRKPDTAKSVAAILPLRPDIIMYFGSSGAADFVKGYRAAGGYAQIISLSIGSTNEFVKSLGDQGHGAIVMQVVPSPYSPTTRIAREFVTLATEKKAPVSYASMQGYISAKALTEGLRRAGRNLTSDSLVRALESFNQLDLGDYVVEFDKDTRLGSQFVEATIVNRQGRFMR